MFTYFSRSIHVLPYPSLQLANQKPACPDILHWPNLVTIHSHLAEFGYCKYLIIPFHVRSSRKSGSFCLVMAIWRDIVEPNYEPCLVPVWLSPRPSRSTDFGGVSETNTSFHLGPRDQKWLTEAKYQGLGTRRELTDAFCNLSTLTEVPSILLLAC